MPGFEIFGEEERKHIEDVMNSGVLMRYNFEPLRNAHWKAKEFETAIQEKLKVAYAHLSSSGTTALITSIKALGIGAGDEIIMPPFTFVASFEAILFTGAIPVFADIDDTLTLSPDSVRKAITPRTKAIMPIHMCGAMAEMEELMKISQENNLCVIEDACQAIGGKYKGKYLGTIGHIGCLSFDFVKTITCGEGGVILTNDLSKYDYCHRFTDHGHDHLGNDRGAENHPIIGLNFRISELQSAIGLAQWTKLDQILNKQKSIKNSIKNILKENTDVKFRRIPDKEGDNASFLSLFLESENLARRVIRELKSSGIPSAYWYDNNWHYVRKWDHFKALKSDTTLFKEQRDLLPDYESQDSTQSEEIIKNTITIPLSHKSTEEEIREIGEKIVKIIINQTNQIENRKN